MSSLRSLRVAVFLASRSIARGNSGVTIMSVALMIVVFISVSFLPSLINGAVTAINQQVTNTLTGDLTITPATKTSIDNASAYLKDIRRTPGTNAATGTRRVGNQIAFGGKSNAWGVDAIDPVSFSEVFTTPQNLIEGSFLTAGDTDGIVLGVDIAGAGLPQLRAYSTSLKTVHVGDTVQVTMAGGVEHNFIVRGIYNNSFPLSDQSAYITTAAANTLIPTADYAASVRQLYAATDKLTNSLVSAASQGAEVTRATGKLSAAAARLASSASALAAASSPLSSAESAGAQKLASGAGELAARAQEIAKGANQLASGLRAGIASKPDAARQERGKLLDLLGQLNAIPSRDTATKITVRAEAGVQPADLAASLAHIRSDVQLQTPDQVAAAIQDQVDTFDLINQIMRVISLLVAAITVFIITYVDLANRRRQIGIERAIGIRSSAIVASYVLKSMCTAAVGTLIGFLIFHFLLVPLVDRYPFMFPTGPVTLVTNAATTIQTVVILMIVAAVSALIPALRTVTMRIMDAIWGN